MELGSRKIELSFLLGGLVGIVGATAILVALNADNLPLFVAVFAVAWIAGWLVIRARYKRPNR